MITKEQIEDTFRKEEDYDRKCGAFSELVCRLLKTKAASVLIGVGFIVILIYIICAGSISGIFLRAGKVLMWTAGAVIFIFAGIILNILTVNIIEHRRLFPPVRWIYPAVHSVWLKKKLEREPLQTEEKLLARIDKSGVKPAMLYDFVVYFGYCQFEKPERCRYICGLVKELHGIDDNSEYLIAYLEYLLAISEKNAEETVRVFEENEKAFSEDATQDAESLITYLNMLGEYYYAKENYSTALEMFLENRDCVNRYVEIQPRRKSIYKLSLIELDIAKCFVKLDMPEEADEHIRLAVEKADDKYSEEKCTELAEEARAAFDKKAMLDNIKNRG